MNHLLLRDSDQMSMAVSLELRVPLLDHLLVEHVLSLPAAAKQGHGRPKGLLIEACRDLLPDSLLNRPKQEFLLPMDKWMRGPLANFVNEGLSELAPRHLLPASFVETQRAAFLSGKRHWTRLWSLVVLGHYCRRHALAASHPNRCPGRRRPHRRHPQGHSAPLRPRSRGRAGHAGHPPSSPFLQQLPLTAHGLGDSRGGFSRSELLEPWLRANAHRFDAAIVHGLWQYHGWAVRKVFPRVGLPYFVFPHGMLDPWFKRAYPLKHLKKQAYWLLSERALIKNAHSVLFTAEAERQLAQHTFWPYQARENVVLYGTDGPTEAELASSPETFLQAHPFLRERPFLLFLSRLHEKKGLDLLLEAWAAERTRLAPRRLVIAGPCAEPAFLEQLKTQAKRLGLLGDTDSSGDVVFLPMLRGTLKWGAFAASEAFILPSHQENFGIAVAEALACGAPALISDQVNIHAEITSDGAGFSAPDTTEGTRFLLQQWAALTPDERAAMRARARTCFIQRFEISRAAAQQAALLKQLLSD